MKGMSLEGVHVTDPAFLPDSFIEDVKVFNRVFRAFGCR